MELPNLQVNRVTIHEVFKRDAETVIQPRYGDGLEELDQDATDALRARVADAMRSASKCVEMSIERAGPGSMMAAADMLINGDDTVFFEWSKTVADLLAAAQIRKDIPGGIVVVFDGTYGAPALRVVGVIKADMQTGFARDEVEGVQSLKFLKSLLLTTQTKLYKVGLFIEITDPLIAGELPDGWAAYIYDETLTVANRYGAAKYFYDGFLGCAFPESSARKTKQFHDYTKDFIKQMNVPQETKLALKNALVTYLRASQSPTVSVTAFGQEYFGDAAVRDAYAAHMQAKAFPTTAVNKDLGDVTSSLRLRRLKFGNDVSVLAPAEGFDDLVSIAVVDAPADHVGSTSWTQLTIKARLTGSE